MTSPKACTSFNSPYPPQQQQEPPPYNGQAPPLAYGQPAYGYGPQPGVNSSSPAQAQQLQPLHGSQALPAATSGCDYPPQQQQPTLLPGAVDPYPPQQQQEVQQDFNAQPPQYPYPTAGTIPMADVSPIVAATPVAAVVVNFPLDHIVALDLGAVCTLPPHTGIATAPNVLGQRKEWVPRPLVWVEADWAKKAFVFVPHVYSTTPTAVNIHTYRCVLHRLDGAPCGAVVETDTNVALAEHLRALHSIVEPMRLRRHWKRSLLGGLCSLACVDFILMPCCFVSRMKSIDMISSGAFVASYVRGALWHIPLEGFDLDSVLMCLEWTMLTPFLLVVCFVPFPCFLCFGSAACMSDLELRRLVVRRHNIVETECESAMAVCCCCPCSDIQVHREIESAGVWPGYCCFSRNAPLRSPEEVQEDYNAITREGVVRSRQGYNGLVSTLALQAMQ